MNTTVDAAVCTIEIPVGDTSVTGFDPIDWEAETRTMIDQVCDQYIAWGYDKAQIKTLKTKLETACFGADGQTGYVNGARLDDAALYILQHDAAADLAYRTAANKPAGGHYTLTPDEAKAASAPQLRAQIQTLIELEATAFTGTVAPDLKFKEALKREDAYHIANGTRSEPMFTEDYLAERRLNTPLKISPAAQSNAQKTADAIFNGDITLAFIYQNPEAGTGAVTFSVNDPYNETGTPVIEMYMMDGRGTEETDDDQAIFLDSPPGTNGSVVIDLTHEGLHGLDDIDGTPLKTIGADNTVQVDRRDNFVSEYQSYYNDAHMTNYDRRENHTLLEKFARAVDKIGCGGGYEGIAEQYQSDPSFALRIDLIHSALVAHKDITPELAAKIIYADSDKAAQAIVDATPEALNTAPDNPVCD